MTDFFRRAVLTSAALLLAAGCSSSEVETATEEENPDAPSPIFAGPLVRGCDWALIFDGDVTGGNSAFPDLGARYWVAVVTGDIPDGSRLRIEGEYPDARYSALHIYNGNLRALDSLADYEIAPNGGANPFLDQTRRSGRDYGDGYTAFIRINQAQPTTPEQNTMYRAAPGAADTNVSRRTALAYRTYLPNGGSQGQVGLPRLTLETPAGSFQLDSAEDAEVCAGIAANLRRDGARLDGSANLLDPTPPRLLPTFSRFDGAAGTGAGGQGVGFNEHNGFLYTKTDDTYGPVLMVRGLAPSYTSQGGAPSTPQVRYWSLCAAGFNTQMVYSCSTDRDTPLDAQGYYTVVVTADSSRPPILNATPGYGWLQRGAERIGVVTQRELLAHPTYEEATVNVTGITPIAQQKGEYLPLATYCSAAVFNQAAGMGPAAAFAACDASRRPLQ